MIEPLPSRGKPPYESAWTWLKEKAQADNARNGIGELWCVDGKLYDLTKFINVHPGGKDFLTLTKGQDITELFHTYHLNPNVNQTLQKYYVKDCKIYTPYFTFKKDGFYQTLKRKIPLQDYGPTQLMYSLSILIALFFLLGLLLTAYFQSYIIAIITGLLGHMIYGIGHSLMHRGTSKLRYIFDLLPNSHYHWLVSHVISHHNFPNSNIDYEISAMEPYIYYLRTKSNSRFIWFYWHLFAGSIPLLEFMIKFVGVLRREERFRLEYSFIFIEYFCMAYINNCQWVETLKLLVVVYFVGSYLLAIVSFPVHRTKYNYSEGAPDKPETDFGLYILQTTADYSTDIPFPYNLFLFESFNDHVLHHLFPSIDISKLAQLHGIFYETMKEFGLQDKYVNKPLLTLLEGHRDLINRKAGEPCYSR